MNKLRSNIYLNGLVIFKYNNILQYYCFYSIFHQILPTPNFWITVYMLIDTNQQEISKS